MENQTHKIAMKPYIEKITEYCTNASKQELIQFVLELATEKSVKERTMFLQKMDSFFHESGDSVIEEHRSPDETILNNIAAFSEDLRERIQSIEDGSYYDELDEYDDYNEETPSYVSEEQSDELKDFFSVAGHFFSENDLETAGNIYEQLFKIFEEQPNAKYELERVVDDIKEERARYCRSVYETMSGEKRLEKMLDILQLDARMGNVLNIPKENMPFLRDIMEVKTGELHEWKYFLNQLKKELEVHHSDRACVLRMEAEYQLQGIEGVIPLAREWKGSQPHGYLFWIQCLEQKCDWTGITQAAREAIETLPMGSFREQAAGYLIQAGNELKDSSLILLGKREKSFSCLSNENILEFIEEAEKQKCRNDEIQGLLFFVKEQMKKDEIDRNIFVKILLMSGNVKEAFKYSKHGKEAVGWSTEPDGLLFASILTVLTRCSVAAETIQALLKRYSGDRMYSILDYSILKESGTANYQEIIKGLSQFAPTEEENKEFLNWCDKVGSERIDKIVSNKYRNAYGRAAEVLGALAETYSILGDERKAREFVNTFYNIKFNRYIAFRTEVKKVFSSSKLLKNLLSL